MSATRELICGDCRDILQEMDEKSVNLIYLDPPFNSKRHYNLPFKKLGRDSKAVAAFKDIWTWDDETHRLHRELTGGGRKATMPPPPPPPPRFPLLLAEIIALVRRIHGRESPLSAYLVNMAARLEAMKRVLKPTGSIYLHCDPTASHYLKLLMDAVFGTSNFRNELVWCYERSHPAKKQFKRVHDAIIFYSAGRRWNFNPIMVPRKDGSKTDRIFKRPDGTLYRSSYKGKLCPSWWVDIPSFGTAMSSKERLGYPTQKPIKLLERIIKASSSEGDLVLDPFCGCGTTLHAAEKLDRRWIGVDISRFAVEVVRKRLVRAFDGIRDEIVSRGMPSDEQSAKQLWRQSPWEFEKWVCGAIGAGGLYKNPGTKGADGGIDGVLEFYPAPGGPAYAIVQVKGGGVKPNDIKALYADIDREPKAMAGVFVCFEEHRHAADNNRSRRTFQDEIAGNEFPLVQVMTVGEIIGGKEPHLPNIARSESAPTRKMPIMV